MCLAARSSLFLILGGLGGLFFASTAAADEVTATWDATATYVDGSPYTDSDHQFYRIAWVDNTLGIQLPNQWSAIAEVQYVDSPDGRTVTTYTWLDFPDGSWDMAVYAVDQAGTVGARSNIESVRTGRAPGSSVLVDIRINDNCRVVVDVKECQP